MRARRVRDAMTAAVYAVGRDTSLETVARLLAVRHVTGVPVVDDAGRAVGVVTMGDLTDPDRGRSTRHGRSVYYRVQEGRAEALCGAVATEPGIVEDVMSRFVLSIEPTAPLDDAMRAMVASGVHRLLVITRRRLVGIITSMDILRAVASEDEIQLAH